MNYLQLFELLYKREIEYMLVGGLAVNLYGVPRMTIDVDIVLVMEEVNLQKFINAMSDLGFRPMLPVSADTLKDKSLLQEWKTKRNLLAFSFQRDSGDYPLTVDVLLTDRINIPGAMKRVEVRMISDIPVRLADIDDLILLKTGTGRRQDQSDIDHLLKIKNAQ